jgi:hypothetical protein
MTIGLIDGSLKDLELKKEDAVGKIYSKIETDIDEHNLTNIINILSDKDLNEVISKLYENKYDEKITFKELDFLVSTLGNIYSAINDVKETIDVQIFLKEGYVLDKKKLTAMYQGNKELRKKYPDLNIEKICDIYKDPCITITGANKKDDIIYDDYVVRKYILAIIQMLFNKMDLLVGITGGEGTGKSCHSTQLLKLCHHLLTEFNIIKYPLITNKVMFGKLSDLREFEDEHFHDPFRLEVLDEGNELNRQDWREPEVKIFFQRLRRERHNQRIKFINIPVLGELMTNIILSRMNFIHDMQMSNQIKTGTLKKGSVDYYIVPRGKEIYSPEQKRNISRGEIKTTLSENLKDKSYLKGMPTKIKLKTYRANGIWGIPESSYEKEIKDKNETFTATKGLIFSNTQLFMFYLCRPTLKKLGINQKDPRYHSVAKMFISINKYFEENINLLRKLEEEYKRKLERKQESE